MIAAARTIHINPVLLPQGVNTIDANWRALADDNVVQRPFGDTPDALIVEVALRIAVGWKGIDDDRILRPADDEQEENLVARRYVQKLTESVPVNYAHHAATEALLRGTE